MTFDFASAKKSARRAVHTTLGVQAFYQDASLDAPIEIRARWHNRIERFGDDQRQGYAEIIEGIERIILLPEIWAAVNGVVVNTGTTFVPKANATVQFPDYKAAFYLRVLEPTDGPLTQYWQSSRTTYAEPPTDSIAPNALMVGPQYILVGNKNLVIQ